MERKKPKFLRKDWHKEIKLGRTVKKLRKWRSANGRHNKIRLNRRGQVQRPKIGWGAPKDVRRQGSGVRVMNISGLSEVDKKNGIVVGAVGKKKRNEIIAKAKEMGIKILNRYKVGNESDKA